MAVQFSPGQAVRAARARTRDAGRTRLSAEDGFTITESVTGLAILFVVVLALIASVSVAVRGILTSRQRSTALVVAEELMEEVRAADYDRVGHKLGAPVDPTLTAGCSAPGSGTTQVWWDGAMSAYRYDDPVTPAKDGERLAHGGTHAVVGGTNAPVAGHCITGTLDNTPYEAWIYVTAVTPLAGDAHKRVTIQVEFSNEQYDQDAIENRARISSLVFPSGAADVAQITALADTTPGMATITGAPGGSFGSLQITFPEARGTVRSSFVDELTGDVTSAWAQLDGGSAAVSATGTCSASGSVATCPPSSVSTVNDDNVTSAADEYDLRSATAASGTFSTPVPGPIRPTTWDGGTVTSTQSACHGLGVTGGVDCGAAFGGPADGLPRGVHRGTGPEDLSVATNPINLPTETPTTITPTLLSFTGAFEALADLDQNTLSASKQTSPTAQVTAPAVKLLTLSDPLQVLPALTMFSVGSVSASALAPVGNLMPDADVAAGAVTFSVAGNPLAIPAIVPGSGVNASSSGSYNFGVLKVTYTASARTGSAVEQEQRTGSVVTNSKAELTEVLVVTLDVEVVLCAASLPLPDPFDDACDEVPPTTVIDTLITVNYGGILAEGTHKEVA